MSAKASNDLDYLRRLLEWWRVELDDARASQFRERDKEKIICFFQLMGENLEAFLSAPRKGGRK